MKIGIIGGTLLFDFNFPGKKREVTTDYGTAVLFEHDDIVLLQRHDIGKHTPPHKINHKANLAALKAAGVQQIIGLYSVGSLQQDIQPGTLVIPEDFVSFWDIPSMTNAHFAPRLDLSLQEQLLKAAAKEGIESRTGIYIQTTGPRLETRAEVKILSSFGDVVGMTLGSEATLACELGIPFNALCSVDNYAHGICDVEPSEDRIKQQAAKNKAAIIALLKQVNIL